MKISAKSWKNYVEKLNAIITIAGTSMQKYINERGNDDVYGLIDYAYALSTKYGEASGALACEMYDSVVRSAKKSFPAAEMAPTATYKETAIAVRGTMINRQNTVPDTVGRLVKQTAADTTLKNALRDGAKFAWIPSGDTCAFCLMLASNGWQPASKKAIKGGHAEHIHANCDCEYAISFDDKPQVEGYDPDYYKQLYENAEGSTPQEKVNSIRRTQYAESRGGGENAKEKWVSDKMKQTLGDDYDDFSKLVNESPNKGLYNEYSEYGDYAKVRYGGCYRPSLDKVEWYESTTYGNNKFTVLAHEMGHKFDALMGRLPGLSFKEVDLINSRCIIGSGLTKSLNATPSCSDEFLKALRKDMQALRQKIKDKTIRDELASSIIQSNQTHGIQDAIDGFYGTQSSSLLPWGHGNKYYNSIYNKRFSAFKNDKNLQKAYQELGFDAGSLTKTKNIARSYTAASEAWANISSAVTVGGNELDYIKTYMPESYKAYMRIVGGK